MENGHLEGELLATRARILEAGHAERWRIERDLHDRAQQRLVALRIHLSLAGERLDRSEERAMLERLGDEVDDAIDELRTVAHGIYPQILAQYGGRRGARGRRPPFGDAHRHPGRWARPPLAGGRDVLWRLLCAAWPTVAAQLH